MVRAGNHTFEYHFKKACQSAREVKEAAKLQGVVEEDEEEMSEEDEEISGRNEDMLQEDAEMLQGDGDMLQEDEDEANGSTTSSKSKPVSVPSSFSSSVKC